MKKYIKVNEKPGTTHLKIELYYALGGMNYFTGRTESRGYYLSVSPVERKGGCESYTSFTGTKILIKAVSRKSAKAEAEAEKIAAGEMENLIKYVCEKNNIPMENLEAIA